MGNKVERLIRNAIRTPDGTYLESRSRHDYVTHTDSNGKTYMVDGGIDYCRRSGNGDEVSMTLSDTEPHAVQREVLKWGTYGKDGDQPLALKPISCMDTDHLVAVLVECNPAVVYSQCMFKELTEREKIKEDEHTKQPI